jgi:hypothetical protein
VELDLNLLDDLKKHASFKAGAGRTCVFSFGCNPGIASHFVRHGLRAVTGCTDMKAAAAAFGLRAIIFAERDTQWPVRGSKEEKLIEDTQTTVLYNTWSPGNYIVETVESTILYAGCPPEATKINAAGPAVTSWTRPDTNTSDRVSASERETIWLAMRGRDSPHTWMTSIPSSGGSPAVSVITVTRAAPAGNAWATLPARAAIRPASQPSASMIACTPWAAGFQRRWKPESSLGTTIAGRPSRVAWSWSARSWPSRA